MRGVAPSSNKQVKVIYGTASLDVTVTGTEPDYFTVQDWTLPAGSAFGKRQPGRHQCLPRRCNAGARTCLQGVEPIGETIRVGNMPCAVVGTLSAKGQSTFGSDQDNTVVMPLRTYLRRIAGNTRISTIAVSANNRCRPGRNASQHR